MHAFTSGSCISPVTETENASYVVETQAPPKDTRECLNSTAVPRIRHWKKCARRDSDANTNHVELVKISGTRRERWGETASILVLLFTELCTDGFGLTRPTVLAVECTHEDSNSTYVLNEHFSSLLSPRSEKERDDRWQNLCVVGLRPGGRRRIKGSPVSSFDGSFLSNFVGMWGRTTLPATRIKGGMEKTSPIKQ